MEKHRTWRDVILSDLGILILLATAWFILHLLTNGRYGFHRDELGTLNDARHLAWGYVTYPPLTPFLARVSMVLFGSSLVGFRVFSALALSACLLLAGLIARELGGSRPAQIMAALAAAFAPVSVFFGSVLMHSSFDYFWWVLMAYLLVRLLKSENPRWWLAIGAVAGLGMMTKFSMGFLLAGIFGGLVLTKARRYLASPWLWGGVGVALLLFLPNLIWQIRHGFIGLEYLGSIHARDIADGRAEDFLLEQILLCINIVTIPFWLMGLYHYFFAPAGRPYRLLGWAYVIPFLLLLITQGRAYYVAPAYPMLLAAGMVHGERWLASLRAGRARLLGGIACAMIALSGLTSCALAMRFAPVGSPFWEVTSAVIEDHKDEIGWPELVETVAGVYNALPAEEKPRTAILACNYGEIGALDLYGPAHGLPEAICSINSGWLRGYGDIEPETVIVVGARQEGMGRYFETCVPAAKVTNRFGVENEEAIGLRRHPGLPGIAHVMGGVLAEDEAFWVIGTCASGRLCRSVAQE